ncbi:MAG: glycoside hydrolase family 97 protein [Lewinellaceae bacterium]|nr:glycoside hydrolase family 97 protein [Lewinellaceae bacterium]
MPVSSAQTKNCLIVVLLWLASSLPVVAQIYRLDSPDGRIALSVRIQEGITWSVSYDGKPVLTETAIDLELAGRRRLGQRPRVAQTIERKQTERIAPLVPLKDNLIIDRFQELRILFRGDFSLVFRVYDDGVAYRWSTSFTNPVTINDEQLNLTFPTATMSYFPQEENLYSHYERSYLYQSIDTLSTGTFCSLPVLLQTPDHINIWISETALEDYPGLFLETNGKQSLKARFPHFVEETQPATRGPDRNERITREADFLAQTTGQRAFPWRIFIISDDDRTLVKSSLAYQLSPASELEQTDWIKPGKVAWDWYNANNIAGVDFPAGLNTNTYRYYIDFAAQYGLEYIILDEGWSLSTTDITHNNPDLDVQALINYGKIKNVGVILWVLWKPLLQNLDEILDTYRAWGAAGVKVDFMQRADQSMVNYYAKIARAAAQRELLVDFHGAFKPAGLHRQFPNVLSFEGVKGNEHNKWSRDITPEHTLILPFTRMTAGPMDFTPGAMRNGGMNDYGIFFNRPMSLGTRCHQLAMYVVYESPLQMLCDSPTAYYREPEVTQFISQIPTVWDETRVLEAAVSDYLVVARRSGNTWYVGAMTDATPRAFTIDLSFLSPGQHAVEIIQDGVNVQRYAEDYQLKTLTVDANATLTATLAGGGGWVAIIKP